MSLSSPERVDHTADHRLRLNRGAKTKKIADPRTANTPHDVIPKFDEVSAHVKAACVCGRI